MKKSFISIIFYIATIIIVLLSIFAVITVIIYSIKNNIPFSVVVIKSIKNLAPYSVAFASIYLYGIYAHMKNERDKAGKEETENRQKAVEKINKKKEIVASIGHSYFVFPPPDIIEKDCKKSPIIGQPTNIIFSERDFYKDISLKFWEIKSYQEIALSECTIMRCYSTKGDAVLKNIIVWNSDYFESEKQKIVESYFDICEKISFCGVICLNTSSARASYLTIVGLIPNDTPQQFVITAITNNGYLIMIKIKYLLKSDGKMQILQQLQYYLAENDFQPLV